ncbi:MAG: glycogen/starch/alpha-glucan phosphorylase [Elusimicrobia bacterium]|nr:glycogen/starch/alpha-glucan phosphorylase [Elusimicrobiota bacterium]
MNNKASLPNGGNGLPPLSKFVIDKILSLQGRTRRFASLNDFYMGFSYAVRDRLLQRWADTLETYLAQDVKVACYLSAEFLMGPQLENNLVNLGIQIEAREAAEALGKSLDEILAHEEEPGLGNGGLGRLAACFLDSLATLERPAVGYGIRYEFGIFDQVIRDGWQVEVTDKWLRYGNPWEIAKPELAITVSFGGRTEFEKDDRGGQRVRWIPGRQVKGVPHDTPIPGYRVATCNTLRLWSAEAVEAFEFESFNAGDYAKAVDAKVVSETISKVLYPNDDSERGKRLRLSQQYFFVACSLQDMLRMHKGLGRSLLDFPKYWAAQLNDTHPSIAVAELMRLLVDEESLGWDQAWDVTQRTFGYTNHTLLPEALETWPLPLFAELLPRHLEIIFEINSRFLGKVRECFPGDESRVARLSLIAEGSPKRVRMAHLACVGSHAINGVAALHSDLLRKSVLKDFYDLWPERFNNKTNGVTPRRFVALANPGLSGLIGRAIGDGWITRPEELRRLEPRAEDGAFQDDWRKIKLANKRRLSDYIRAQTHIDVDPEWLFDIQVKRIHEYKRQHLNVLHIIALYWRLKANPSLDIPPRAFIFGGKAAPGYFMAKRIIKLVNAVGDVVNGDSEVNHRLRVVFVPNFNVQNAELIYPAADLSEQISTAGKEASGTGNMKFAMNGALTIGTLDGANVEIREEVGPENFFLFGLNVDEVHGLKARGYRPWEFGAGNPELKGVLDLLGSGHFSGGDRELFRPLVESLWGSDEYLVLADFAAYAAAQEAVSSAWRDSRRWTRMSILNTARSGKFSSDRVIREYCDEIWGVRSLR